MKHKPNLLICLISAALFMTAFISGTSYINAQETQDTKKPTTLEVGKYHRFHSKVLNEERTILVHLPRNYEQSKKKYPVIFLLDAEFIAVLIKDIGTINLMAGRDIPELIIIGVENTNRNRDTFPVKIPNRENTGGADKFLDFFQQELIPYVDKTYRTQPYRILYGGSNAGMLTAYALIARPQLFGAYIASSPMVGWCENLFLTKTRDFLKSKDAAYKFLYMVYGDNDFIRVVQNVPNLVKVIKENAPKEFLWECRVLEKGGHVPFASISEGLKAVFADLNFPIDLFLADGEKGIKQYLENLSKKYGYPIPADTITSEQKLNRQGYQLLAQNKYEQALKIFIYIVQQYPNSWNAYDSLGEAYMKKGDKDLAIKNYEKSVELNPNNNSGKEMLNILKK